MIDINRGASVRGYRFLNQVLSIHLLSDFNSRLCTCGIRILHMLTAYHRGNLGSGKRHIQQAKTVKSLPASAHPIYGCGR